MNDNANVNMDDINKIVESANLLSDLEVRVLLDELLKSHSLVLNPVIQIQMVKLAPRDAEKSEPEATK